MFVYNVRLLELRQASIDNRKALRLAYSPFVDGTLFVFMSVTAFGRLT